MLWVVMAEMRVLVLLLARMDGDGVVAREVRRNFKLLQQVAAMERAKI